VVRAALIPKKQFYDETARVIIVDVKGAMNLNSSVCRSAKALDERFFVYGGDHCAFIEKLVLSDDGLYWQQHCPGKVEFTETGKRICRPCVAA
jgi:hypothetical protein